MNETRFEPAGGPTVIIHSNNPNDPSGQALLMNNNYPPNNQMHGMSAGPGQMPPVVINNIEGGTVQMPPSYEQTFGYKN